MRPSVAAIRVGTDTVSPARAENHVNQRPTNKDLTVQRPAWDVSRSDMSLCAFTDSVAFADFVNEVAELRLTCQPLARRRLDYDTGADPAA